MSVPAYPEYKDSSIEWLGAVPRHWVVQSIKWLSPVQRGASPRPIDDAKYFDDDGEYAWVRIADATASDGNLLWTTQRLSELGSSLSVRLEPGQLFVSIAGTVGKPCITGIKACIHDGFVYFPNLRISPKFLFRVFEAGYCYGGLGKMGTQLNLNTDTIGSIRVPVPPAEELDRIITFLDQETAKIDGLVAEQERLIALLKEKRQAVISHAVTKGINPNTSMKDSGIEWLGQISAHWEVVKVVRFFRASKGKEGQLLTKEYCAENAGEFPVYSGQTENEGVMGTLDRYEFDSGERGYLFSTTVGAKAMTVSHIFGRFSLSQNCMIIRPVGGVIDPRFYYYHFQAVFAYHRSLIPDHMQPSFRMEDLYSFSVALPPKREQIEISSYLDEKLVGYRALEIEAQAAITLLQERRAALISAAVTGKIDVRGLAVASSEMEDA